MNKPSFWQKLGLYVIERYKKLKIREAQFALRVVQRKTGLAGIVCRRKPDKNGYNRLQRIGAISPIAFTASMPFLREATDFGKNENLKPGPFYPLDNDWGSKVACFALTSSGLSNPDRLIKSASNLRNADPNETTWWLGRLTRDNNSRALRALRILTEAVK